MKRLKNRKTSFSRCNEIIINNDTSSIAGMSSGECIPGRAQLFEIICEGAQKHVKNLAISSDRRYSPERGGFNGDTSSVASATTRDKPLYHQSVGLLVINIGYAAYLTRWKSM